MSGPAPRELAAYAPFGDLSGAALAVLGQLRREVGFSAWALTRVSGGTSTVLVSSDLFPAAAGEQFPWTDTLCHRVFEEGVPRVTLDVRAVASLRDTPFARRWGVGAYLSAPLSIDGETLFGTLCALDPEPREPEMLTRLPLVDLQARLLSTMLASDVRLDEVRRRAERAEADALVDAMTGLVNRRGWQLLLDREEQRCRRYGSAASVLVLDLDGLKAVNDGQGHPAGDVLLQRNAPRRCCVTPLAALTSSPASAGMSSACSPSGRARRWQPSNAPGCRACSQTPELRPRSALRPARATVASRRRGSGLTPTCTE